MLYKNLKKAALFFLLSSILFTGCNSSDDSGSSDDGPQPIEQYYFKGLLDGEELVLEKNIYESFDLNDPEEHSIDYGGSQIYLEENPNEPETAGCQARYACGLLFGSFQDNPNQLDEAKMYFSKIPLAQCTSENEINALNNFVSLDAYTYARFPETTVLNNVAFDFFPEEFENNENYYSSRFGDNSNASFDITSITEIEDGIYVVEGAFSCKLYGFNDSTDVKDLINGEFKIKIRKNID